MPRALILALLLCPGAVLAVDTGPAISRFCDTEWRSKPAPSEAETRQCADLWLRRAYGPGVAEDDLELDPPIGGKDALAFTAAELQRMQKLVERACGRRCDLQRQRRLARAAGLLSGEAGARFSLLDPSRMVSIEPLLRRILDGEKLAEAELALDDPTPWSALTLWHLRNAVYARHGHEFKNPDLDTFFYGKRPAKQKVDRTRLLPVKKPAAPDATLTAADSANLGLITRLEKALRR